MRPMSRNPRRAHRWKRWLDRIAVAWIVCAPLGVLAAGWLGLCPGETETGHRAEAPIQCLGTKPGACPSWTVPLPQRTEPSALPAGSAPGEPWRTAYVRPRP